MSIDILSINEKEQGQVINATAIEYDALGTLSKHTRELIEIVELQGELTRLVRRYQKLLCRDLVKMRKAGINTSDIDREFS